MDPTQIKSKEARGHVMFHQPSSVRVAKITRWLRVVSADTGRSIRRHRKNVAIVTFCFLLLSFPTMTTAGHPGSNDTPLDMEMPIQPLYPFGLSVFNLYWDENWDANNPGFLRATIDAATIALLNSTYEASLAQYGVPNITWGGSTTAASICGSPTGNISSVGLIGFLQCEEVGGLFNNVPFAPPALPVPSGSIIYNVIIPNRSVVDDGVSKSCTASGGSYNAYHFFKDSPLPALPFGIPPPPRRILYTVIPVACVTNVVWSDRLTA